MSDLHHKLHNQKKEGIATNRFVYAPYDPRASHKVWQECRKDLRPRPWFYAIRLGADGNTPINMRADRVNRALPMCVLLRSSFLFFS